jgi:hypothetical protein
MRRMVVVLALLVTISGARLQPTALAAASTWEAQRKVSCIGSA